MNTEGSITRLGSKLHYWITGPEGGTLIVMAHGATMDHHTFDSQVSMVNSSKTGSAPPYDELLETIAEMLDRMLTPEGGGDIEAGKNVLRQLAEEAKRFFDQLDTPTTVRRQP